MVELALCDMSADFGTMLDQPLVFQNGERLANGVAGQEEFGRQRTFQRQAVGVGADMDLLA